MKNILLLFFSIIVVVSCVGPEEPLDGLSKNSPVIVSTNESFTFSLRAESYSTEENYNLSFSPQNPIELATVLVITDFAGRSTDTSYFEIYNSSDSLLNRYELKSNINVASVENVDTLAIPNKIFFKSDDYSGLIQLVLAIGD